MYIITFFFLLNLLFFVNKIFPVLIFDVGCFVFTWSYHLEDMNIESSFPFPASAHVSHQIRSDPQGQLVFPEDFFYLTVQFMDSATPAAQHLSVMKVASLN